MKIREFHYVDDDKSCIRFEAYVKGKTLWRVWREGTVSTPEKKRQLLERDIELAKHEA